MPKLIVGCGYLGSRVAQQWRAAGEQVWVTTRSPERARTLEQSGYWPLVLDVLEPGWPPLPAADTVLWAVGHDRRSGAPIERVYVDGLARLLEALPDSVQKLIYISSTGVYGDFGGGWVNEESPCQPERAGGQACLAAEQLLARSRWGAHAIVLRMAGIYGPDRLPYLQALAAGRPLEAPAEGFLNLIHVDDAVRVVLAADGQGRPPRVYLVSDGHPVERGAFYAELSRLLRAPAPSFCPSPDAPASHRAAASKQISNARLMAELAPRLKYPTFREGLAALAADYHTSSGN